MKVRLSLSLVALFAFALSSARGDSPSPAAKELALLQGEWKMVSGIADGFPIPAEMVPNFKRVCKGNEVTATVRDQLVMRARVTLDPTAKPKTIDYEVLDGPTKGQKHLGIYEIDGDTFKSCFGAPSGKRPSSFESKEGDKRTLSVWKRKAAERKA